MQKLDLSHKCSSKEARDQGEWVGGSEAYHIRCSQLQVCADVTDSTKHMRHKFVSWDMHPLLSESSDNRGVYLRCL